MRFLIGLSFRFDSEQERVIDGLAEGHGGLNVPPKKRNDDLVANNAAFIIRHASERTKREVNDAVIVVENWNIIEKDNWGMGRIANWNGGRVGLVGHDGISRYYDEAQFCWLSIRQASETSNIAQKG